MKRTLIMTLIAAAFTLPGIATAGAKDKPASAAEASTINPSGSSPTQSSRSEAFKTADANGDGFLSMTEAKGTAHSASFASLDTNGDGKLSPQEFAHTKEPVSAKDQLAAPPSITTAPSTQSTPTDAAVRK